MRKITSGFTLIEILVVVAIIGILSTISVISFARYQADSRDSQRAARANVIAEALEKFYDKNGEYPSCSAMTAPASTITSTTLPGIDVTALVAPRASSGVTNSIELCSELSPSSTTDSFAYVGDGSTACTNSACLQYSLQYLDESTGTVKTITSRHTTDILTSGDITDLSATPFSFSQINLSWTAVGGASHYVAQAATNASFTTGLVTASPDPTTNSASITGLTIGTLYYLRVKPATATATGNWSNTATATTYTLDTPVGTAVADPSAPASQIKFSWNSVANATSYTVERSASSSFTSPTTTPSAVSPITVTGLTAGTTLYFRVKAVAPSYTSGWSATAQATTNVPQPTGLVATTNSSTQITASWTAVTVANTYTLQYATDAGFTSPTTLTGIATNSKAVTGLTPGKQYFFRVYALVGTTSSIASSTANATTTIDTPAAPGATVVLGGVRAYSAGRWIYWDPTDSASGNWYYAQGYANSNTCPAGTTAQFSTGANYNSPSTFRGWTGWDTDSSWYIVRPYSPYTVQFYQKIRCVGTNYTSAESAASASGYAGP